jgi:protein sidekick
MQPMLENNNQFFYQMCNLSKFTLYTMSILCFTNSGDGPATQPIQLKTFEDIPGEVNNIKFVNVYDTSIEMEWQPPVQPNGRILTYIISYSQVNSANQQKQQSPKFDHVILDASQNNFTLKNLKSSTEYVIGIRARTQAGEGTLKLTQIKSGVPPELPEPPKIVFIRTVGNSWCEIEFIPGYNGKTSISKWIIEAYELGKYDNEVESGGESHLLDQKKWKRVHEITNAPNATRLIVENLRPFTNYTLRMWTQNIKGVCRWAHNQY